jgi:LmbE family N-acetylglucosaminyl deacetylase
VVAAHPDDEVLGAGGLLAQLARRHPMVMVWATDGEGSHPDSTVLRPRELAQMRREESRRALVRLGVAPSATHRLGLPDSGLAGCRGDLDSALRRIIEPDDLVLCTWRADGHPDHEAVGQAVDSLAVDNWQFPIWMWHWALPDDPRVPWDSARRIGDVDVDAKAQAIGQFVTQVEAIGSAPEDAAILPPHVLAHFTRPVEIVFAR